MNQVMSLASYPRATAFFRRVWEFVTARKAMTFAELCDYYDYHLDVYIQEAYWEGGLNTTRCFEWMLDLAKKDRIFVKDEARVNYDEILWNVWTCTEKGLS